MGVQIKNKELVELLSAIQLIDKVDKDGQLIYKIDAKARYHVSRRLRVLKEAGEDLNSYRERLVDNHGLRDSEGKSLTPELQAKLDAFSAEWKSFLQLDACEVNPIPYSEFKLDTFEIPSVAQMALAVLVDGLP